MQIGMDCCPYMMDMGGLSGLKWLQVCIENWEIDEQCHRRLFESAYKMPGLEGMGVDYRHCTMNFKQCQWTLNPNLRSLRIDCSNSQLDQRLK